MPSRRSLPLPLGMAAPRMGWGRYLPLQMSVAMVSLFYFRCAASSSTRIPSTPAEPLLAVTCAYALSMLPRWSTFSIILTTFTVISAPLKARLAGPPCRIKGNLTFGPSVVCEASGGFPARFLYLLWLVLTSPCVHDTGRPPQVRAHSFPDSWHIYILAVVGQGHYKGVLACLS